MGSNDVITVPIETNGLTPAEVSVETIIPDEDWSFSCNCAVSDARAVSLS